MTGMNKENMNDKLNERSMRDILSDEIDRRLTENPPKKPTLEEFKAMAYKRLEEDKARETIWIKLKGNRKLRIACYAVCFVLALIIGGAAWNKIAVDVDADKNPKEEIITDEGVIIEDGGWGSSVGEENVLVVEDWENVDNIRKVHPGLLIPNYVPEKFCFDSLIMEMAETDATTYEYLYSNAKNETIEVEIRYKNSMNSSFSIANTARVLESVKGKIFVNEEDKKMAIIQTEDGTLVHLWGNISDEEIVKIINSLN